MINLTISEIRDLALFAGLELKSECDLSEEDLETEITVTRCPDSGIKDDDGSEIYCRHIAYLYEYPEEGSCPLGETSRTKTI